MFNFISSGYSNKTPEKLKNLCAITERKGLAQNKGLLGHIHTAIDMQCFTANITGL